MCLQFVLYHHAHAVFLHVILHVDEMLVKKSSHRVVREHVLRQPFTWSAPRGIAINEHEFVCLPGFLQNVLPSGILLELDTGILRVRPEGEHAK